MKRLVPASVMALKHYNRRIFLSDLVAGVTVGLVALPLAMAFAISSGMPPQTGIYCAIVAGFLTSALGGSRSAIGGPTGAFVVVVAGIISRFGVDGLYMCTMMAGVMLIALGVSRVGSAIKYIPRPVVIGFTNGIAVLIASTQIRDFFGLQVAAVPDDFVARIRPPREPFRHALLAGDRDRRGDAGDCDRDSSSAQACARHHSGDDRPDDRGNGDGIADRNHRHAVRRRAVRASASSDSGVSRESGDQAAVAGAHGGAARRDRVAAVGDGGRSHDGHAAQSRTWSWWRRAWRISFRLSSAGCLPPERLRERPRISARARRRRWPE